MDTKAKVILLVIIAIFVAHSLSLNFTQDDAFISYRYAKNFINGHGLVFNPGVRVEGYTNFLWIIFLSIFAKFGLDIIVVSKILGIASGCVVLFLFYKISALLFQTRNRGTNSAKGKNQMVHTKAERTLFLNSKFRENYYTNAFRKINTLYAIFKRKGVYQKENQIFKEIEFVNLYNDALNLHNVGDYRGAIEKLKKVAQIGPRDFAWVYEFIGEQYYFLKDYSQGEKYLKKAIEMDDYCVDAHFFLSKIYLNRNMDPEAQQEKEKIRKYSPSVFGLKKR